MSNSSIYVPVEATEHEIKVCGNLANALDMSITYHKGRGMYLSIYPCVRKDEGYYISTSMEFFSADNKTHFIEPMTRGNAKKEKAWRDALERNAQKIAEAYYNGASADTMRNILLS